MFLIYACMVYLPCNASCVNTTRVNTLFLLYAHMVYFPYNTSCTNTTRRGYVFSYYIHVWYTPRVIHRAQQQQWGDLCFLLYECMVYSPCNTSRENTTRGGVCVSYCMNVLCSPHVIHRVKKATGVEYVCLIICMYCVRPM